MSSRFATVRPSCWSFSSTLLRVSIPAIRRRSSTLRELIPQRSQALARRPRQGSLLHRGCRVLEMLEARVPEKDGGNGVVGEREAERRLHEAVGVALVHEGAERLRATHVSPVIRTGSDWIHTGHGDGMARLRAAQRARREDADGDDADLASGCHPEHLLEVLGGEAARYRIAGAGVQQVEADLGGVESAAVECLVKRLRVTEGGDPVKAELALPAELLEGGDDLVDHA